MRVVLSSLIAIVLVLFARSSSAEPTAVTTGMYVNQIHELNLKDNYFVADVYVWFRWKGDIKPSDTFAFIDGRIDSKTEENNKTMPDGSQYQCFRVVVKVTKYWDVRRYPLDHYAVSLVLEESKEDIHVLRYEADERNSSLAPEVKMPGYLLDYEGTKAGVGAYHTNFGDASLPSDNFSEYARITTTFDLRRDGNTYFVKLFFALWIAVATAFLSFFIKPTNLESRFGLGVGAIFASIASEYAVTGGLPEIGAATLADRLHVVGYATIFLTLAWSTASLWLVEHDREAASKRFDRRFAIGLAFACVLANVLVIRYTPG